MIDKINILGLTYEIREVEVIDKDCRMFGQIDYINQVIKIDKELTQERKDITLLHEIIHGISEQLGLEELNKDERVVQSLATALHQTLKESDLLRK